MAMLKNFLLTSYRHIAREKVNFCFKVGGLTLALFSLLIVTLYVLHQLSFDRHHKDYERIYRVNTQRSENGNIEQYGIAPVAFGSILENDFPELESFARIDVANGSHLRYEDKVVFAGVFAVDSAWFDVFTHEFIQGSRQSLARPGTVVLTERTARKIFGDEDPMHKTVTVNNGERLFEVTGVIRDVPATSHITPDAFIPVERSLEFTADHIISPVTFVDNSGVLFIKLRAGVQAESFTRHLENVLDLYVPRARRDELNFKVFIQPLKDIYLDPPLKYEFTSKGSMLYLYAFLILGLFLFAMACINYTNLSLVAFMNRSREMGVRKVMGGRRWQIVAQVALDTVLYCMIALVLSLAMLYVAFPQVLVYIEPHLRLSAVTTSWFIFIAGAIVLLVIVFSTALPALWFATNKISNDLKGVYAGKGSGRFNNSLLLAQFVTSVICISATLTVGKQIDFIHNKDLGIDRKNLLVLTMSEDFTVGKMLALKTSLKSIPGVTHVSNSSFRIGGGYWKDWYTVEIGGEMKSLELYEVFSDDELFATLGMRVLDGRVFDADHKADSGAAFVINETAARLLGMDNPVGARILTHPEEPGKWEGTIVGVVNDINISSLREKIQPLVMRLPWQNDYPEYFVYVRIDGEAKPVIESIKKKYDALQPHFPLEVHFVDDFYNNLYEKEQRAYASLRFGTIIILLISSMGVFSLSLYLSVRRMKEFGIRKVLGATAAQIAGMHVRYFFRVAVVAFLVALPVAYLLMNEWLNNFAYRVDQDAGGMLIVLTATLLMIVCSAGYAALRAGRMNPVDVINRV